MSQSKAQESVFNIADVCVMYVWVEEGGGGGGRVVTVRYTTPVIDHVTPMEAYVNLHNN